MGMKKLFVIGGMGAGKSTARKVLAEQGVPYIDLDKGEFSPDAVRETTGFEVENIQNGQRLLKISVLCRKSGCFRLTCYVS